MKEQEAYQLIVEI